MSPEAQQDLSFKLNNSSSKSITIEMAFARSTTNGNGLAIYDSSKAAKDSSLKYNIEDFVNIPKKRDNNCCTCTGNSSCKGEHA